MPRERGDTAYLGDMLQFALEVLDFTSGHSRADYDANLELRRAVERSTELIGEAASNVSDEARARHPEIPWRKIVGQRHVLIHGYGDVDDELVWNLVEQEMPKLVELLQRAVEKES